jgi:acylphosphatase
MADEASLRVLIRGRVQGVGYRAWTAHRAELAGLSGWVRNRRDGSVEAVFAGPGGAVETMLAACREGPRGAAVTEVEIVERDVRVGTGFEVRPTI